MEQGTYRLTGVYVTIVLLYVITAGTCRTFTVLLVQYVVTAAPCTVGPPLSFDYYYVIQDPCCPTSDYYRTVEASYCTIRGVCYYCTTA